MTQPGRLLWWRRAALAVLWAEFGAQRGWAVASVLAAVFGVALLGIVPGGVVAPCLFLLASIAAVVACDRASRKRAARPRRGMPKGGWSGIAA